MKTWIVTALLLLLVPASASAGTIAGKLPRKAKPMTVRIVRMDTGQIIAAKRIRRPKYRIKVARGPYMVFASAGKRRFKSRAMRVGKRGTRKAKVRAASTAGAAPLAIVGIDPNLTISGLEGYRAGLPIEAVIASVMFENECANGGEMKMVETANREALEREIELSNSKYFDPKTRITPHFVQPDTIISGHGQVAGDTVTIDVVMRGKVNGASSVTMPLSKLFEAMDAVGADLKGQICRSKDEPPAPAPPPPPATGSLLGYRGSLSGSATITSLAGVITESWTSSDVRFSRIASSDSAPGYEITQGTLSFNVSGTVGGCTVSGAKAMPLPVAAGDAESALDLAPDHSYFAVGYPNDTLDVTYTCPGQDGSFTTTYTAMNEFLRTDAKFVRRMPGPNGTINGSASATRDGTALKWTWALKPLV
jgi:hypothetical protein